MEEPREEEEEKTAPFQESPDNQPPHEYEEGYEVEHGAGEEYEAHAHMMGARLEEEEKDPNAYNEEGEEGEQIEAYDPEEAKQEEEADPIHD